MSLSKTHTLTPQRTGEYHGAVDSSRNDWKIDDWDIKPQYEQKYLRMVTSNV